MGTKDDQFIDKLERWRHHYAELNIPMSMAEPIWIRAIWVFGLHVPPPIYWRSFSLILFLWCYNSLLWCLLMWPLFVLTGLPRWDIISLAMVFGVVAALFHTVNWRSKSRTPKIKTWSEI